MQTGQSIPNKKLAMRFSKEKIEKILADIRFCLVKKPNASIYFMQDFLEEKYGHQYSYDFINRLAKKVFQERAGEINRVAEEVEKQQEERLEQFWDNPLQKLRR